MRLKDLYKKRLGIALSSGAARGFAHLGVLEILTQAGIRPYCIAGSSAGAVMGAIYCGGKMSEYIQRIQDWTRRDTLVCMDPVVPRSGLINGHKILEFNSAYLRVQRIEQCRPKLAIVATEANTGQELVLESGDLVKALRGSISIPGLFTPGLWQDKPLLDGGLVNPLPVDVCKRLGAEQTLAIDVNSQLVVATEREGPSEQELKVPSAWRRILGSSQAHLPNLVQGWLAGNKEDQEIAGFDKGIIDTLLHSINIMQRTIQRDRLQISPPDYLLQPRICRARLMDFHRSREIIEAGRRSGQEFLDALQ